MADGLDYSAKLLISYCLAEAAESNVDKSKEWVKLASEIDDDGVPEFVVRFVSAASDVMKEQDPNEDLRVLLKDRIKRLERFMEIAEKLINKLEGRLRPLI